MIGALCESPLTFEALTVWRDELNEGKVLLRDIIDLEAMYGAGPDGQPAPVPPPVGPDGKPLDTCRRSIRRAANVKRAANCNGAAAPSSRSPSRPSPSAEGDEGEDGGEAAAAADSAADGDDFDDEGNLPLVGDGSRAEAAGAGDARPDRRPLQEAGQAAGRLGRSGAGRRRTVHRPGTPLQEAAQRDHGSGQVAQAQQQPHRSPGRPDVRHQSPSGVAGRQAAAPGRSPWRGPRRIPQAVFRQRARSQLGAPRRPAVRHRLA